MRRRVMSGLGVLVLAAGMLVAPLAGAAFAKGPKGGGGGGKGGGGGGGKGDACARATAKRDQDIAKGKNPNKIAQDQKKVDQACGGASAGSTTSTTKAGGGGGGGGHFGSQQCQVAQQKQTDDYQADELNFFMQVNQHGFNSPEANAALQQWQNDYNADKANTHANCG